MQICKMMKKMLLSFAFILSGLFLSAQESYDWGDSPLYAKENYTQFHTFFNAEKYAAARPILQHLLESCPRLHPRLYEMGTEVYQALAKATKDPVYQVVFQDSTLILFDLQEKYFGLSPGLLNRKGIVALPYRQRFPEKFPALLDLYAKIVALNENDTFAPNLKHYIFLATSLYQKKRADMTAEKVRTIYKELTAIVHANRAKDVAYWDKIQAYLTERVKGI
jgi:tetratricopeptide (TPR) repeat protein